MNYTDEDIRRYIDSFPGDCILYRMKDGHLSKPVSAQSLCEMIAECIREKTLHENQ